MLLSVPGFGLGIFLCRTRLAPTDTSIVYTRILKKSIRESKIYLDKCPGKSLCFSQPVGCLKLSSPPWFLIEKPWDRTIFCVLPSQNLVKRVSCG